PLPAIALVDNAATLTAIANDYGFEHVFSRQIQALGQVGDVAIGITTSGESENVLNGLREASIKNLLTIAFCGIKPVLSGPDFIDTQFNVPSANTARIQEVHIALGHIICECIETGI